MFGGVFEFASTVLNKVVPDAGEREKAQLRLVELAQAGELAQLSAQAQIITAEANGSSLQRNWRPLLMLTFTGLIVARWFGYTAPGLSEAETLKLWSIVEIGLGGYVIGRSAEKIAPGIIEALKGSK